MIASNILTILDEPASFVSRDSTRPSLLPTSIADVSELLTRAAVRKMLSQALWRPPRLAMAKNGRLTTTEPTDTSSDETLIMHGLHLCWPPIQQLCARVAARLGHPVQANAYLSPPNSQGYSVHTDPHSVLVIQVEGSKVWNLFAPVDTLETFGGSAPQHVFHLKRGSVLFIPLEWPHCAFTESEHSLHITFGLVPLQ
jgi:bifunctional lysine-specific demethylase and histidyl-hydroxylase NO66